jgi:hypothetical protein
MIAARGKRESCAQAFSSSTKPTRPLHGPAPGDGVIALAPRRRPGADQLQDEAEDQQRQADPRPAVIAARARLLGRVVLLQDESLGAGAADLLREAVAPQHDGADDVEHEPRHTEPAQVGHRREPSTVHAADPQSGTRPLWPRASRGRTSSPVPDVSDMERTRSVRPLRTSARADASARCGLRPY